MEESPTMSPVARAEIVVDLAAIRRNVETLKRLVRTTAALPCR